MKILLSYAQVDRPWADELATLLREAGLEVMDDAGHSHPGGDWEVTLRQLLESAELVIFILTQRSLHNPWLLFEFGAASNTRKPLLPLLVKKEGQQIDLPNWIAGRKVLRVESSLAAAEQVKQYISERMVSV